MLTDQARTKQELEQIQRWDEQQQRWMEDLSGQISEAISSITTGLGQPGAGPAALAREEVAATDGKP